jgi:hypothetical protein
MAIFRAGKRIGNMDIRIGLPRDRSLDNVEGDKRLKRKQYKESNEATTIGRFMAEINRGEGVARANRFLIKMYPPRQLIPHNPHLDVTYGNAEPGTLESNEIKENVELMCTGITFPHRDIATTNFVTYGPGRKMPYAYIYHSTIQASFMADKFLRQRAFFENWQNKMFDSETHNLKYYDSYVGQMDIYQLGQYREAENEKMSDSNRLTYGVRLHEVYPATVGEVQLQSLTDDIIPMEIPITFAFRSWENLTLDAINFVGPGKSVPDMPNIKPAKDYGIIGGILSKMPPEIRRASKTVIEKIRRDIPIGKGTGGRVFPPFVINK